MNKELIISSNGHETAVAILEDDLVTEVFIERDRQRGTVGNIYKGRVSKVLPGMQSAFVDIGLERDAFLYVSEVYDTLEEFDRLDTDAGDDDDDKPEADPDHADGDVNGNVDPAVAAKPQAPPRRNGRDRDRDRGPQPKIQDLLEQGQEVLVQVVKEPLGTKGARITSHASMPGRFLVFMPTVDHIGISRKIDSREKRSRLRRIVREFKKEHNFTGGVIIRTAAGGRSEEDIVADLTYFHQVWTGIRQRTESNKAPAVVYQEESLVAKLLRDFLTKDYTAIRIDNAEEYGRVVKLVERIMPDLVPRVHRYAKSFPIFDEYGVQDEIDKALRPKVWLKSGGYLVINHTEALVAIDVNTGRYVGKRAGRLEDTIVKTNLEAVKEIVRQFRLRDLGGIIVLDLIDMEERKNRQKIFQAFEQELRRDRSPSKAVQVVDVGLIIVTRKRVKQTLERQLTDACPYCSGSGTIKSTSTICYEILAEMQKIRGDLNGHGVVLRVNPEIARALQAEERGVLRDLRAVLGGELTLKPDARLHHEQFDVMAL
ncbi:MAG: Rne/Rng family ribonuclease [Vicinamibacterales bacterium]|jgi:ribonuclease G|nr:Rne/Rng family ribonuclease [Acidobacteriota bacterium]MDP6372906.1 Rne/Rng family ribonuclease [Vicinamibacterales bacterium]MDP6609980.1 Rne/Rng family ribonuclease [Vicinamibacterales bacterium]HAK56435.1 Rne/Rng family ribonuclease [Acidobacteriota bacterium]|tara:strand:+ start:3621 stop:5243 length:1623 start_codon:yes stop_codon:yes gene_type:complete